MPVFAPDDTVQVVFLGVLIPPLKEWLDDRGLYLAGPMPIEDDVPTYFIDIKEPPRTPGD